MNRKDQQKKEDEAKQREITERIMQVARNGKKAKITVLQSTQQISKP